MENELEKKSQNEMETGFLPGFIGMTPNIMGLDFWCWYGMVEMYLKCTSNSWKLSWPPHFGSGIEFAEACGV